MKSSKLDWIRLMIVLVVLGFMAPVRGEVAMPSPTPLPTDGANHADAAQQAQNAKAAQQAILPFVMQAIAFYTPKCMGGQKSNCGMHGSDSCTCAAKAWAQYQQMMASMAGAQANSEDHSGGGTSGNGKPGAAGIGADFGRLSKMMTDAGFKLNPDGSIAAMPNGSALPSLASSSGGGNFNSGDFKLPNFDQNGAIAGGPTDKAVQGKGSGNAAVDSGGGGGGLGSRPPNTNDEVGGKKGSVSGLSRKFGKDTIGVAGDNIFEMVTRRYKSNETKLKK